jgi:hypothetical protein
MTNEELFELIKSHFNNEYIKQVTFDFTSNDINLTVVPPVSLEYIKFDCVLVNKEKK